MFAENMRTGKPWAGARLLISNGQQVFAEGTTGKDGVFQKSYKELKDAGDVRVFAVADGHVASNVVDLQGRGRRPGLTDKGYIYTDRPAYRAGQMVHVRGCLRHAVGDVYTVEKDKKYTLDVFDTRNRLLWQETVKLGEFGSFHAYFALPATSPQGQYRVLVHDDAGQNYQGGFLVREYRLEPMRLMVDTPRHVYYRGEEIEGTIRAAYYYGAPLAGREIRYQLADDRQHTATTDAKGEVHFKLPTREFSETQLLTLQVALPERNLQSAVNFMLSAARVFHRREHRAAGLRGRRDVRGHGQNARRRGQTHRPRNSRSRSSNRPPSKARWASGWSRSIRSKPPPTARPERRSNSPRAATTSSAPKGSTASRTRSPASARCRFPATRTKCGSASWPTPHTYKVGDTAAVKVHWRESPALGLVTFQGARVLDYRLVELKTGVNELSIPMTDKLVPNFELSVAVMTDVRRRGKAEGGRERRDRRGLGTSVAQSRQGRPQRPDATDPPLRFHEASSPFNVDRDLRVKIVATAASGITRTAKEACRQSPRPGDEVEIAITTTDPQGKPVAAELSLAMIEQSLLDRFREHLAPIQDFFQAERREPAVRTTSSITFAYIPATQPINPRLLAEEDRLALAAEEEASRRAGLGGAAWAARPSRLTMGVTPRIIIQEEEEEKLGEPDVPMRPLDESHSGRRGRHESPEPCGGATIAGTKPADLETHRRLSRGSRMRNGSRAQTRLARPRLPAVRSARNGPCCRTLAATETAYWNPRSSPTRTAGRPSPSPCPSSPPPGGCWPRASPPTRWPARPPNRWWSRRNCSAS